MSERTIGRQSEEAIPGKAPLFSVIVPVHDKVRHVDAALRSVLCQTFEDFELIVIDDASTDGSSTVLDAIEDQRIRRLRRDTPGPGGYAARNLGVSLARGTWITFLDADDAWIEDRLERLAAAIRAVPDVRLHACAWYLATRDGMRRVNRYARRHGAKGMHVLSMKEYLTSLRRNEAVIHTDTVAIHRGLVANRDVFPADQGLRRGGDVYAWLWLMAAERRLAWSPHVGAEYFVDSDNMVTRRVPITGEGFRRTLIEPLALALPARERGLLYRTANNFLWLSWLRNVFDGTPGFSLPRRLLWRGAFSQALTISMASLVPRPVLRALRRMAILTRSGG